MFAGPDLESCRLLKGAGFNQDKAWQTAGETTMALVVNQYYCQPQTEKEQRCSGISGMLSVMMRPIGVSQC